MALSLTFKKFMNTAWITGRSFNPIGLTSALVRGCSSSVTQDSDTVTQELKPDVNEISTNFVNRNPRNLELLGLSWKRSGWRFQYPSKEFYHRIVLDVTNRNCDAHVEHSSGAVVVSCSTKELAIRKHLYRGTDTSAAFNVGKVLAQRCIESGLEKVSIDEWPNAEESEKFQEFKRALVESGLDVVEQAEIVAPYSPGIDYENKEKTDELALRQRKVWTFGRKTLLRRWRRDKRRKGRKNPVLEPIPLNTVPAYTYYS